MERLERYRWRRPSSIFPCGGGNRTGDCFALPESRAAAAAAAAVTVAIALGLALGAPSSSTIALAGGAGSRCPTTEVSTAAAAVTSLGWPGAASRGSAAAKSAENMTKVRCSERRSGLKVAEDLWSQSCPDLCRFLRFVVPLEMFPVAEN